MAAFPATGKNGSTGIDDLVKKLLSSGPTSSVLPKVSDLLVDKILLSGSL